MAFTERINLVVDVVTGNAKGALGSIKSDMDAAEGAFNKAKAGISGAFGAISTMAPAAAAAGVAAVGAFAIKSIDAFQQTALAADKFRDTTGASLDESSRWIAVANDVGVSAETMQSAFVKMEKAIDNNRTAFGDLIVTAKDGSVDMSATFLNAVTHLQSIQDPIQRANESAKLFGKGFAEVSEIITTDADQIKTALEGVSDAQIIDEGEVQKARDYQAAMDELADAVRDIGIAAGETLIPVATALAGMGAAVVNVTDKVGGLQNIIASSPIIGNLINLQSAFDGNASAVDRIGGVVGSVFPLAGTLIKGIDGDAKNAATAMGSLGSAADFAGGEFAAAATDMDLLAGATGAAGAQADQLKAKWQEMMGALTVEEATLNLQDSFARVGETATAAFIATADNAANADAAVRDNAQAVNSLKQDVIDYGKELGGLPPEVVSDILAMIDQGKLAEAENSLTNAARKREAELHAKPVAVPAAEAAFNNAVRTRQAIMNASPQNVGAAESAFANAARTRSAIINAQANTGAANSAIDYAARNRTATITIQARGGAGYSNLPTFQEGGVVPGPTGKAQLAVVHGGETVVPADVARAGDPVAPLKIGHAAGGGTTVNFYGPVLGDKATIGRYMDEAIAEARRRGNRAS